MQERRVIPAGTVIRAHLHSAPPPFLSGSTSEPRTQARASGLRYEKRAQEHLQSLISYSYAAYSYSYLPSPWISFYSRNGTVLRWCQPDGLLISSVNGHPAHITIVEIKVRHCVQAWWQLRKLYEPVVRTLFGDGYTYSICEVCHWIDPHANVQFPERFQYVDSPGNVPPGAFGIYRFSGKKRDVKARMRAKTSAECAQ